MTDLEIIIKILEDKYKALTAGEIKAEAQKYNRANVNPNATIGNNSAFYQTSTEYGKSYGLMSFLEETICYVLKVGTPRGKPLTKSITEIATLANDKLEEIASNTDYVKETELKKALDSLVNKKVITLKDNKYCRVTTSNKMPSTSASTNTNNQPTPKPGKGKNNRVEAKLHRLLSSFVALNPMFSCYTKTIDAAASSSQISKQKEWLNPDIVGIRFPFGNLAKQASNELEEETRELISATGSSGIKLYSFELKRIVNFASLKEYYFQAVSNSSWANEGYLVALKYGNDDTKTNELLFTEMKRLANAFGIGFIELNPYSVIDSKVLFPARVNDELDWFTVNTLCGNEDFRELIGKVAGVKGDPDRLKGIREVFDEFEEDQSKINEYIDKNPDLLKEIEKAGYKAPIMSIINSSVHASTSE